MAHLVRIDQNLRIPMGEVVIIGRSPGADVQITDRKASSEHCRIERTKSGHRVSDLESQNGTWLNGKRVRRHALKAGDVIAVGTTEFRFEEPLPRRASGRQRQKADKAFRDLESAFDAFLRVSGHDDREVAAQRLQQRAHDIAESLVDPEVQRLRKLVSWIRRLTNERDLSRLLSLMLDSVVELTGAERGFLMLLEGNNEGRIRVARSFSMEDLRKPTFKVARSVAEHVAREGQAVLSTNADEDPLIRSHGDTGALYLRSVVCVPIRMGKQHLGSVYLDNRFERGVFRHEDLPFLISFADQAAIALKNASLHEDARRARKEIEELNTALRGRVEQQEAELHEVKTLYARAAAEARTKYQYDAIIGESPVMRELFFLLDRVTDSDVPVFLYGESGSGKELAARAIHFNGPRRHAAFVSENCAAIPEPLFESELFGHTKGSFTGAVGDKKGLFQLAHGGTLFLDEVAEMPFGMQAKLLRVLQEREVRPVGAKSVVPIDVRIVTASNKNLAEQVRRGEFREDLYHRIHVIEVPIPPLRRRPEDVPLLVGHFLERVTAKGRTAPVVSKPAMALLQRYEWPGNVRELENEILRACTLGEGEILPETLSDAVRGAGAGPGRWQGRILKEAVKEATREVERALITDALRAEKGNKSAVARRLGISRPTLDAKMESLKIPRYPA
ncbi:MAG: sigma 54-interacting transcriptional regulator [Planctomycetota bacterium]|nr:sigma 54-interacting transcriptional regulator [Planctomycetota bacterium]